MYDDRDGDRLLSGSGVVSWLVQRCPYDEAGTGLPASPSALWLAVGVAAAFWLALAGLTGLCFYLLPTLLLSLQQ